MFAIKSNANDTEHAIMCKSLQMVACCIFNPAKEPDFLFFHGSSLIEIFKQGLLLLIADYYL